MNIQVPPDFAGDLTIYEYGQLFDLDTSEQLIPSSVVLVVKLSTGAEFTVGNVPAVDAVTGIISYTWTAAESSQIIGLGIPSVDHRAEWSFTVGPETIERGQFFDVPVADLVTR